MANIRNIIGAIVLALFIYGIYHQGVINTNAKWEARIEKIEEERDRRIANIEEFAKTTLEQTVIGNYTRTKDITNLVKNTTILTNVPCTPNSEFINTYNEIIKRGNK